MKKLVILGLVISGSAAWAVSDNASPNACFGQDRAAGVHAISGRVWGSIASQRKGDNAGLNADYRDACQG